MNICPECDKKLSCGSSLTRHIKSVHDKIKNHLCSYDECELKFTSKSDLVRHVKYIHMKEKKFKCSYDGCNAEFVMKNKLSEHIKCTHEDIRLHNCIFVDNGGIECADNKFSLLRIRDTDENFEKKIKDYICENIEILDV
jgi:uncharacterized Zn-finger protein